MLGETWSAPNREPWENLENFGDPPPWKLQQKQTLEELILRITYADRRDMLEWLKDNYHKFRAQQKKRVKGQLDLF